MATDFSSSAFYHEGSEVSIKVVNHIYTDKNLPPDLAVLSLVGELNLYSTPILKEILDALMKEKIEKFLIDVSALDYVDSSGLGTLISFQSRLMKQKGFLRVCSPSKNVGNILDLTKLRVMLKVCDSMDIAFEEL